MLGSVARSFDAQIDDQAASIATAGKRRTTYRSGPTLHREGGFAFRFRASDGMEPPHVHVRGNGGKAKIWLTPVVRVRDPHRYTDRQVRRIASIAEVHRDEWLAAWRRFFDETS